jgi:hypothetical protein
LVDVGLSYRLQQFWRNLTAGPLTPEARGEVEALLSPPEVALFEHYSLADQWHSYRVLRTLREAGHTEPDLLRAALLHDIGKSRVRLSLWDRTLIVAAEVIAPEAVEAWGREESDGWKRPFAARVQHPAWGAEMAAAAGSAPGVVELIRRHADDGPWDESELVEMSLAALQWADDQN